MKVLTILQGVLLLNSVGTSFTPTTISSLSDYNSNLSSPVSASLSGSSSRVCSNHLNIDSIPSTIQSSPPPSNSPPRPLLQSARSGNSLNVLQWNVNGIRSKHKELLDFLVRNKVYVALIQESKLRAKTPTPTFSGYSTLRLDRPGDVGGGGLLALISRQISYTHTTRAIVSSLPPDNVREIQTLSILIGKDE